LELGVYTFGDLTPDPVTGRAISAGERYREILEAAKLAEESSARTTSGSMDRTSHGI